VDENLCGHFAARLRLAGLRVEELHQHLPRGTKDTEWLPYVGSQGWVAVTLDLFRDDPEEQLALMMHRVPVFVLVGRATQDARADVFIRKRKWIRRLLESRTDPFMVRISAVTGQHTLVSFDDLLNRYARRRR